MYTKGEIYRSPGVTSQRKSEELVKAGLNPMTADYWWNSEVASHYDYMACATHYEMAEFPSSRKGPGNKPAWSAECLIQCILPGMVTSNGKLYKLIIDVPERQIYYADGDDRMTTVFCTDISDGLADIAIALNTMGIIRLSDVDLLPILYMLSPAPT